jgi:hypothetical protein
VAGPWRRALDLRLHAQRVHRQVAMHARGHLVQFRNALVRRQSPHAPPRC